MEFSLFRLWLFFHINAQWLCIGTVSLSYESAPGSARFKSVTHFPFMQCRKYLVTFVENMNSHGLHLSSGAFATCENGRHYEWSEQGFHDIELTLGCEITWEQLLVIGAEVVLRME
jgi:hypothetical protein